VFNRKKISCLAKLLNRSERSVYYWLEKRRTPRFTLGEIKEILKIIQIQNPEEFPESIQEILELISEDLI